MFRGSGMFFESAERYGIFGACVDTHAHSHAHADSNADSYAHNITHYDTGAYGDTDSDAYFRAGL